MSASQQLTLEKYLIKLERQGQIPSEERSAFLGLRSTKQIFSPNNFILSIGDVVTHCIFMESGLTSRVKIMKNGERQVSAFNIPGDAPNLQGLMLDVGDHGVFTHTQTQIVSVAHSDIRTLTRRYPLLCEALWLDTLIEAAITREWVVNVEQRKATARIAHLLLEMEARFLAIGQSSDAYFLGINQTVLRQALALSLVHVNKSLRKLRHSGLVEIKSGRVVILDREAMQELAGFDPIYLHLGSSRNGIPCS